MHPQKFLDIADYLCSLSADPPAPLDKEILLRTQVSRGYYYLYHVTRKILLERLNDDTAIAQRLDGFGIKPERLLGSHRVLIKFYLKLAERLQEEYHDHALANLASDIAQILKVYRNFRTLADYRIDSPNPSIGRYGLDFKNPQNTPKNWEMLHPRAIQSRASLILTSMDELFRGLTRLESYDYALVRILEDLERTEYLKP